MAKYFGFLLLVQVLDFFFQLPIDLHNCSKEDLRRIKHLRRPRDKIEAEEEITTTFDPLRYLSKS